MTNFPSPSILYFQNSSRVGHTLRRKNKKVTVSLSMSYIIYYPILYIIYNNVYYTEEQDDLFLLEWLAHSGELCIERKGEVGLFFQKICSTNLVVISSFCNSVTLCPPTSMLPSPNSLIWCFQS